MVETVLLLGTLYAAKVAITCASQLNSHIGTMKYIAIHVPCIKYADTVTNEAMAVCAGGPLAAGEESVVRQNSGPPTPSPPSPGSRCDPPTAVPRGTQHLMEQSHAGSLQNSSHDRCTPW